MSNFAFLRAAIPTVHLDFSKAEAYLALDPRTAVFYARRAIEGLVTYLYDVLELPDPYATNLAALMDAPAFKRAVGEEIGDKLTRIRISGNDAAHPGGKPVRPELARAILVELHHVAIWAAFRHSPRPDVAPTGAAFDADIAEKRAPLTRGEFTALQRQLEERDATIRGHEAEIADLKKQIAEAQAANVKIDDRDYSEVETRVFIDADLNAAGWPLTDARDREYPVTGMPNAQGKGFVDYVLWGADGRPLAVVEAKRTAKSAEVGREQARLYADRLEAQFGRRPVIFYSNGYTHVIWDDAGGYPPRPIQGFYTCDELELLIQRRSTRLALANAPVNSQVAGRPYQVRAIRSIGTSLDGKERRALLVMATGSGKTRTIVALVDQLMKANWVKRVLFLADRTALVKQAARAFTEHLPSVATVNLVESKDAEGRVYVATYPTMRNLIEAGGRFGPGYFDLVIIDEAHRSVYAKYGAIFEWFDSLLVGLTATPKDEVDFNTYRLFHLEDGVPTDAYGLDEAVADGYLVPPKGVSVGTKFLRQGIRYDDLSEDEKDQWDALDWGTDDPPEEVGAAELNQFLFNADTVDRVLGTLMRDGYKVAGGDQLGKTIIFAKNQAHADFIVSRFDLQYPEYAGHFARTITHGTPYAQHLIDSFSDPAKAPHIAVSVDMLDTGIDVPEVVNLVFFTAVRSKTKFWQMIGRGTRLAPDLYGPGRDKEDFLVFDFCGNLEFFEQDLPTSEGSLEKSLTQRVFENRLHLVHLLDKQGAEAGLRHDAANALRDFVCGMNPHNVLVRPHREAVTRCAEEDAWQAMSAEATAQAMALAGLPSAVKDGDEDAKRFDLLILRGQLAQLEGDVGTVERVRETAQHLAAALLTRTTIPSVGAQAVLLEAVAGDEWWTDVTLPMLEDLRRTVRDLVRFVERTARATVYTDFVDETVEATEVHLARVTPGTNMARFKAKAEAFLRKHTDHVALQRLRRNRPLTAADLESLEDMLLSSGTGTPADLMWARESSGGLGLFARTLVGLDRQAANEAFADYLDGSRFTADQVRFIGLIIDELTSNGVMDSGRLFESPFTDHAPTGPDFLFPEAEVMGIVDILRSIRETAEPPVVA
ncbi:DEAD/DEAH box helicase family protein [Tessaracoccus massiliensis]|uniref:DEAD/DEAH box helicase family protein n=1 Tax=Tessaracoccus massiliensis TaxID=1522311 RepID=UPI00058D73EC|nr:DEAD/DEAH box helicase family protein [Tessaracoccus massiliensis]